MRGPRRAGRRAHVQPQRRRASRDPSLARSSSRRAYERDARAGPASGHSVLFFTLDHRPTPQGPKSSPHHPGVNFARALGNLRTDLVR